MGHSMQNLDMAQNAPGPAHLSIRARRGGPIGVFGL